MKPENKSHNVNVRLSPREITELKLVARSHCLSTSGMVRYAIRRFIRSGATVKNEE